MESGIETKKPVGTLKKVVKADFKEFSKAVLKGGGHIATGSWDSLIEDGVDVAAALGIEKSPGEVAWLLVYRALYASLIDLVTENLEFHNDNVQQESIRALIGDALASRSLNVNKRFFEAPAEAGLLNFVQSRFASWLLAQGIGPDASRMISERVPTYFTMRLHHEWLSRPQEYAALREQINTPFTQASDRAHAWLRYSAWLIKQVDEPMFNEAFGLRKVFVQPRAYFRRRAVTSELAADGAVPKVQNILHVVDLEASLTEWVSKNDPEDAIRLISGGPGSGKSSFVKMFASEMARRASVAVLFVPLHHFEPSNDLIDALGRYVQTDGFGLNNPLLDRNFGQRTLIIFDGLDELAMQGKVAAKTAQDFIREVQRKVERLNQQSFWLQVLISGRELVVQQYEADFRKEGQILHLLPYFVEEDERERHNDPDKLLAFDQRQQWWRKYGDATGAGYEGLPPELDKPNLSEVTSQPLLNYLVALSLGRGKLHFSSETNLNAVYSDLLKAIYERGWSKHQHASIQGLDERDFCRVLEEIALASWHGDGRTTTIREIKAHCDSSGLNVLLDRFESQLQGDPQTKVTHLLTAFYFRQSGHNAAGDNTFEFTHKSFGEYLTAKRIVREMQLIRRKLVARKSDPDEGWDEREALHRWALICGPTGIDEYLLRFIFDELALENAQASSATVELQEIFCLLFETMLRSGLPLERIAPRLRSVEERQRARNAEAALLICLNGLSRLTGRVSQISWDDEYAFGDWLVRTCGQPGGFQEYPVLRSLSHLDLSGCWLNSRYLWNADFECSKLVGTNFVASDCRYSNFRGADLEGARFAFANLHGVDFAGANLRGANFEGVSLRRVQQSRMPDGGFEREGLDNFIGLDLSGADFHESDLRYMDFSRANLRGVSFVDAALEGANFSEADIEDADFTGSDLSHVDFSGAMAAPAVSVDLPRARKRKPMV